MNQLLENNEIKLMKNLFPIKTVNPVPTAANTVKTVNAANTAVSDDAGRKKTEYDLPSDPDIALKLDLTPQSLVNGIIMSEILGKPRSLRKGR